MKNIIRKTSIFTIVGLFALTGVGCNKWLDIQPENMQASDDYWKSKEEVAAVVNAMYAQLRNCEENFFEWGEVRGDMLALVMASQSQKDARNMNILTTTDMSDWSAVYRTISYANAVLEYGKKAYEADVTFEKPVLQAYEAEARFIRALCHFYLLRTFGDVPYVTKSYIYDDGKDGSFRTPKNTKEEVIEKIYYDLNHYDAAKPDNAPGAIYKLKTGYGSTQKNVGYATRYAGYALLADVALWNEDYETAVTACTYIQEMAQATDDRPAKFGLVNGDVWYSIFSPGNSIESIFELQWKQAKDGDFVANTFLKTIYDNNLYAISRAALQLYEPSASVQDKRGRTITFIPGGNSIWKYAGKEPSQNGVDNKRANYDNGWIFYRYAEVLLMKAEALIMQSDEISLADPKFSEAWALIKEVRIRAGLTTDPAVPDSELAALILVLDERAKEFLAEGKRWFDLLRVGKRDNFLYEEYLQQVMLAEVTARERPIFVAKLQDRNGYYLPLPQHDIDANGTHKVGDVEKPYLEQNSYYTNLD